MTIDAAIPDASVEKLRADLAAHLRANGQIRTDRVEKAFLAVERHLFLPGVDVMTAYAPRPS